MIRRVLMTLICLTLMPLAPWAEEEKEGGIIGTGVVGEITALGSIIVNGLRIETPPGLPRAGLGSDLPLQPGMVVAARVERVGNEWRARDISRLTPLVGPVTSAGKVMGVPVANLGTHRLGDWVIVDGFWTENGVDATRVTPTRTRIARVTGTYLGGPLEIGGIVISGIMPRHLVPGDVVTAEGSLTSDGIKAIRLAKGAFQGVAPGVILAQGYLSRPDTVGLYTLYGSGLIAYAMHPDMIVPPTRLVHCAVEGRIDIRPDTLPDETRRVVRTICN